ncbi:7164_t:CDS:1, partial [Racocetra persica]
ETDRLTFDEIRSKFDLGAPDVFIKLANQCMDKDLKKRPTAKEVYEQLKEWEIILYKKQNEMNEEELKIKNKFLEADKIIPTQPTFLQKHQDV